MADNPRVSVRMLGNASQTWASLNRTVCASCFATDRIGAIDARPLNLFSGLNSLDQLATAASAFNGVPPSRAQATG